MRFGQRKDEILCPLSFFLFPFLLSLFLWSCRLSVSQRKKGQLCGFHCVSGYLLVYLLPASVFFYSYVRVLSLCMCTFVSMLGSLQVTLDFPLYVYILFWFIIILFQRLYEPCIPVLTYDTSLSRLMFHLQIHSIEIQMHC